MDHNSANMEYGRDVSRLIGRKLNETMLHALTILTVLRLLSDGKTFFSALFDTRWVKWGCKVCMVVVI